MEEVQEDIAELVIEELRQERMSIESWSQMQP